MIFVQQFVYFTGLVIKKVLESTKVWVVGNNSVCVCMCVIYMFVYFTGLIRKKSIGKH